MDAYAATIIGFSLFVSGAVLGIMGTAFFMDVWKNTVTDTKLQDTMNWQAGEIKRLRAQVALHIGKEKNDEPG